MCNKWRNKTLRALTLAFTGAKVIVKYACQRHRKQDQINKMDLLP